MSSQKTAAAFAFVYAVLASVFIIVLIKGLGIFCAYGLLSTNIATFILLANIVVGCLGFFFTGFFCEKQPALEKVCLVFNILSMTFCIYGDLFIPEWKTHFINGGLTVSAYLTSVFLMVFGFIELVFLIAAGLAISLTSGQAVVKERNIPAAVALSVLTFGIFFIYWIYQMIQSIMLAKGDKKGNSAGELLCFLFLPILFVILVLYEGKKDLCCAEREEHCIS